MILIIKDLVEACKIIGDGWGGYLFILCDKNKSSHIVNLLIK
jgi:galactokinase/mevalonate kinase-like predicted kinase